jgi:hypothetical protein
MSSLLAAAVAALPASAGFTLDDHMPYDGVTAYTDTTVVSLYWLAEDNALRVEVYDADGNGDTFFEMDLTGLPAAVAAAWVAHALTVTPPPGYAKGVALADLERAAARRDETARAYAAAAAAYDRAAAAYRKFV